MRMTTMHADRDGVHRRQIGLLLGWLWTIPATGASLKRPAENVADNDQVNEQL
jgi:hypothetical protein